MKFKLSGPLTTHALLQKPQTEIVKGVTKKTYSAGEPININFRTFGGTERIVNGAYTVENTGTVETWFRPDITSDCRLVIQNTEYEIIGDPENIGMRNQYLSIRVRALKGGV